MKNLEEIKSILAKNKQPLQKKYNFKHIGIFGSYASGFAEEDSDVDILVEFEQPIGLSFVSLADELEILLGIKVDLVSKNAIKQNILPYVLEDLTYV